MDLTARISSGQGEFVLFAITPPRQSTPAERLPAIAQATVDRLSRLDLDGLVLYDIDDESSRNPVERPFPFSPTVDPSDYRADHLHPWRTPVIVYRAVGKYQHEQMRTWIAEQDPTQTLTVMVGAASSGATPALPLADAQAMRADLNPDLLMGGVAISRAAQSPRKRTPAPDRQAGSGLPVLRNPGRLRPQRCQEPRVRLPLRM